MKTNQILFAGAIILVFIAFLIWYIDPKDRFKADPYLSHSDTTKILLPDINVSIPPGQPIIVTQPANSIPSKIDTSNVVKEYYLVKIYNDSTENDTVKINIKETVSQNRIYDRQITYKLKLPVTKIENYYEESRRKLLVGPSIVKDSATWLSLNVAYQNKKNILFYGGTEIGFKRYQLGVFFPISLKRK